MKTDKYTIQGSRLERDILSLARSGDMEIIDAITIIAVVAAVANDRPVDGARWAEECRAMLSAKEDQ